MSNPAILWTAEQTEELKRLYGEGLSCSAIAAVMGKSRNAVIGRAHRIGLERRGAGKRAEIEAGNRRGSKPQQPREKTTPRVRSLRPSQEQIELRVAAVDPLHIGLLDLESHHCRYPYGDTPNITFCGHQVFAGFSYCAPHFFLCTGLGTPSERAATDISKRVREAV